MMRRALLLLVALLACAVPVRAAVAIGTNAGFLSAAPTDNPGGSDLSMSGRCRVLKMTSPSDATGVTEIGWYVGGNNGNAYTFDAGLYSHDAGNNRPSALLGQGSAASSNATGWRAVTGLTITVTGSTVYWGAIQSDAGTAAPTIDYSTITGERSSVKTTQTQLEDPWGTTAGVADTTPAIYVVYSTAGGAATIRYYGIGAGVGTGIGGGLR